MTGANFHKPLDRLRWRAGRVGVSRSEAVANAEAKLVEIKDGVLGDCDRELARLHLWAFGQEESGLADQNAVYDVAHDIAAIAGTFGYEALGKAAFGLCDQLSGEGAGTSVLQVKAKAHIAAMALLRQSPSAPRRSAPIEALASLRAAAPSDALLRDGGVAMLVYASLAAGGEAAFTQDAAALASAVSVGCQDLGVTGLLLCHAGWFLHWIEGDPASLAKLYAELILDERQSGIKVLSAGNLPNRRFSGWRMVSAQSGGAQAALLGQTRAGFSPHDLKPKEACALLEAFASLGDNAVARRA